MVSNGPLHKSSILLIGKFELYFMLLYYKHPKVPTNHIACVNNSETLAEQI